MSMPCLTDLKQLMGAQMINGYMYMLCFSVYIVKSCWRVIYYCKVLLYLNRDVFIFFRIITQTMLVTTPGFLF
jgi:hypothetical protein